ncbi:hypothetical protein CONCODRAFT_12176 [Conidiobolus coronatus NRRL 28638]|uniref:F-box domain-containing protein n=1 Tax=Conidiobolus coronatus (strain ATCC 28846 / CBS 209.66 / NRRL 28638) TaxID=796925 RepID=A0A137NTF4_CONC2|nr:hypothetical protein CONCODRAFT_12176 [Conidiobolus coronatus NRRL 28638]|eukprot:KXN66063.1 hypothetical protein CONCODRAFT_12176 [Conidiobolus coronatus NRRL 28638]
MNQGVIKDKLEKKAWIYLPDTYTLSNYFKQNDIVELSKVCKNYRTQLKSRVLKRLNINTRTIKLLNIHSMSNRHEHEYIINSLRLGFAESFHLVRQVIIDIGFSNKFACDFFVMFPKLSNIKIVSYLYYDINDLIRTLRSLEQLQHITLNSEFNYANPLLDKDYYNFFYPLKTIKISTYSRIYNEMLPLHIIGTSFINLECLTVVNNRILSKLSNGIPSLLYVEFCQNYQFDLTELNNFISNNLQLKQISISDRHLDEKVINSILNLKNLYKLEIIFSRSEINSFNTYIENYSIKHFIYTGYGFIRYNNAVYDILKMCKNLNVYQVSDIKCYEDSMREEFPYQSHRISIK